MNTPFRYALAWLATALLAGTAAAADAPAGSRCLGTRHTARVRDRGRLPHDPGRRRRGPPRQGQHPRAAMTHLHSVDDSGGMTRMRAVDSLEIPAGHDVTLAPQGLHLMLMGVDRPLIAGERFPVTLHFAHGGDRIVDVLVVPATAAGPPRSGKP